VNWPHSLMHWKKNGWRYRSNWKQWKTARGKYPATSRKCAGQDSRQHAVITNLPTGI